MRGALLALLLLPLSSATPTQSYAWDGTTATLACARVYLLPPPSCPRVERENGSWMRLPDGATRVTGVLSFEPRTSVQQVMRVFVQGNPEAQGPPVASREFTGHRVVPFDVDLARLPGAWHSLSIHGDYRSVGGAPASAVVEVAQPFHVEMSVAFG